LRSACESVLEALNLLGTFGSGNGTFINGKRLTKSKKMLLHSGDQIGIVTDKERLLVEMGYTFQPIN
jgi:pSer/pThr/pTyr-binding forkhead associated (FHA) protein